MSHFPDCFKAFTTPLWRKLKRLLRRHHGKPLAMPGSLRLLLLVSNYSAELWVSTELKYGY